MLNVRNLNYCFNDRRPNISSSVHDIWKGLYFACLLDIAGNTVVVFPYPDHKYIKRNNKNKKETRWPITVAGKYEKEK